MNYQIIIRKAKLVVIGTDDQVHPVFNLPYELPNCYSHNPVVSPIAPGRNYL